MKITRKQSGRRETLSVPLSFVLNELSSAKFSNIIDRIRRDNLTITMWTRRGIRVTYTFPSSFKLLDWVANVTKAKITTRGEQAAWVSTFAGYVGLRPEYIESLGADMVFKRLLGRIDHKVSAA